MTRVTLLFDLDGTLTDSKEGIVRSIRFALDQVGASHAGMDDLGWCIGPPIHESFLHLLGEERHHIADEAVGLFHERFASRGWAENRVFDGIQDCLETLDADFTLRVATLKPTFFANKILTHFGLGYFLASIDGAQLDGSGGNKAAIIRGILEREGLAPKATLMIGDTRHDIHGAQTNGVRGIGVGWGYGIEDDLRSAGAWAIVNHPTDLPDLLRNML